MKAKPEKHRMWGVCSRHLIFATLMFGVAISACAKDRKWQEAKVLDIRTVQSGSQAVVLPLGNGLYGASATNSHSFYRLQTGEYTYIVPNYSNGAWIKPWLRLTIGGTTKISIDNAKTMHLIDDEGKERSVSITQRIVNSTTP